MKYLVKKDIRFRKKQNLSESKNFCLKFFLIFVLNLKQKSKRHYFCLKFFSLQPFSLAMHSHEGKSRIVRRCILTGRGRSITRAVGNLSRTVLKDYFSMGFIPGYKKALW